MCVVDGGVVTRRVQVRPDGEGAGVSQARRCVCVCAEKEAWHNEEFESRCEAVQC